MGDSNSDWTGVRKSITADKVTALTDAIIFEPLDLVSVSNSIKVQGIDTILTNDFKLSSFYGYIMYKSASSALSAEIRIQRLIPNSDVTNADGSIVRIEEGRELLGCYFTSTKVAVNFVTELKGAMPGLTVVGVALASSIGILAF